MWYVYRQNNSGGYYLGPAEMVIVRADSMVQANILAWAVGVSPSAPYCDCCGTRWSLMDPNYEADEVNGYDIFATLADIEDLYGHYRATSALIVEA